jgi:hypothetical protein
MTSLIAEVLADSPAFYWPLDEGSGTVAYDASGNGRNGTVAGTAGWVTTEVYAPTGRCSDHDTDGDVITSTYATDHVAAVTAEAWFRTVGSQADASPTIIGKITYYAVGALDFPYGIRLNGSGQIEMVLSNGGDFSTDATLTGPVVTDGRWHHVVGVFQNGTSYLYLDGRQVASAATSFNLSATTYAWAAARASAENGGGLGQSNFRGRLAHLAVYPSALSAARVAAPYNAARAAAATYSDLILATPGCLGYWPLNGATATDVRRRNDLTLTGTPTTGVGPDGDAGDGTTWNGSSQYAMTPADGPYAISGRDATLECWLRRDSGSALASPVTVSGATGNPAPFGIDTYGVGGSNKWRAFMTGNTGGTNYLEAPDPNGYTLGRWYHLVAVYRDSTPRLGLWVDGVEVGSDTSTSGARDTGSYRLHVSRYNGSYSQYFPGLIAHVAIYGRQLTASEITARYRAGSDRAGARGLASF